ncbi:phage tail sheath family protein [Frankia sp. CNm7]|uniref:Phage tail sheath family protein n=1 Tax=Frankia nepalensis TaxID=1836974 RepID=A0A937R6Q9_9ACTN|nr:phage tail sheath subtilisin-like domain-containing protein [Frankia nepalensis]MBL7494818.1 phage tail sheath family protein [Frankia nepalensis]MBL7508967.1 phage tail sheath family protein [Frankia nepalensis]MBL7524797.1 phage tail sheath family protein [Frankia nepalensis]MBL7626301.1 phage tail sheath family protein [Frankia nepalensis]
MPQYLTPGVYVEEVPSAVKPIAGVGTSTAGFIGAVADDVTMPLRPGRTGTRPPAADAGDSAPVREPDDFYPVAAAGTAVLVDSWDAFRANFGDVQPGNAVLANAVYGFFNNGGSRALVTRVASGTDRNLIAALESFTVLDEIAIVAIPGAVSDAVQTAIIDHCEHEYAQDRFAVLDGRRATSLTKAAIAGNVRDSSYAAVYYPWIQIGVDDGGAPVYQPPSGHVAGVYARVDAERGVHKAPANEVIRGALGVETTVGRAGQAGLNPGGVNVIRPFGANVTIWGARTTAAAGAPEWKYIGSRRLFNFIRESIDEGLQWAVFEPNSAELWSKVRRNVTAFLTTVWAGGALLGATPEQAFYVRCDETTNPPEVRDLGQLVAEVGIALVNPAEFVVFRISQWAGPAA